MKRIPLVAWGGAVAAVYVARTLWPEGGVFRELLTDGVLIRIGGVTKLAFLLIAWTFARRNAANLDRENPARRAWRLLSWGILAFALGQAVLTTYQLAAGASPYPSAGDALFMVSYPLLIASTAAFVGAYRQAGYPVGSGREHAALGLGVVVAAAAFGYWLLRPVLAQPAPLLEHVLNVAYPALDLAWLVLFGAAFLVLRSLQHVSMPWLFGAWSATGAAVGLWTAGAALAATIGPTIGGVLVTASWRWVFLINLPLGAVTAVAGVRILREARDPVRGRRPDLLGALLLCVAIGALALGIVKGAG